MALAGLASEFGVVMLVYLDGAIGDRIGKGKFSTKDDLDEALIEGAVLRLAKQITEEAASGSSSCSGRPWCRAMP